MEDNNIAIGYGKLAFEHYNRRVAKANKEDDTDDDYFGLPQLTEEQQRRLVGAMHRSFDNFTEQQAFDKS